MEPTSPDEQVSVARRVGGWSVAVAAMLGMSVSYIDRQTLAAIAPSVKEGLRLGHTQYGWLISAFSMAYLVGAPLSGVLVDRIGARRGFAYAVVVWSLVAAAHAFVPTFGALFFLRILLGAAESPSFPAAVQAIRRALPTAGRSAALGLLFTGSSLGAMVAAPLAVFLEGKYGWRFAFVGTAVVGTAWLPLWLTVTRADVVQDEDTKTSGAPSIYRGTDPAPPAEARWSEVVTSGPVLRALVAVVGSAPLIMFVLNWSSQYLVERWHIPKGSVGSYLVFPPLAFDIGAVAFGFVASRRPTRTHKDLLVVGLVLGSTLALLPFAPSAVMGIVLFAISGFGGAVIYVVITADMIARVPLGRTSSAGGMTAAAQSLSHIVASPLVGYVIEKTHGFSAAAVGLGLLVIPTTLAFMFWPRLRDT